MQLVKETKLVGAFDGYGQDKVFTLTNGEKWQQARYKYKYKYKYRPVIKIWKEGSKHYMEVDGMSEMVEVKRIY